jgi:hypothetical protein
MTGQPVAGLMAEQEGVVTSAQAVGLFGRAEVRGNLRLGRWRRICPGVLLTENGRLRPDQQKWVAVLAAGAGAILAGATAAAAGGVRGLESSPMRVLIPAGRVSRPRLPSDMPELRVHRTAVLPPEHVLARRPARTTIARSVVDAAAWAHTDRAAQAVLTAACQQRLVKPEEIAEVLAVLTRVRRRMLIMSTVVDIAGGAQALSEIDLVDLCRRSGLPAPSLQERRRDAEGRNRYLDAYWREWRLHVEVDGAHHMDPGHWAADMLRQNQIWIAGDRILRFPARLIRSRPAEVAAQLEAALRAAGWQPDLPRRRGKPARQAT